MRLSLPFLGGVPNPFLGRVIVCHGQPDDTTEMICGFCSTGCSLRIHLKDGQAINLSPTTNYPVNLGMACPKGWEALTPLRSPDRATTPYVRNADGRLEPVDWDTALQIFTLRFKAIQDKFGRDAIAWLGTRQICIEEMAFLGALAKFGMGVLHGDGNTRQCMATPATTLQTVLRVRRSTRLLMQSAGITLGKGDLLGIAKVIALSGGP